MVDIHCHILPGIDDGSDSWETTTQMCRMAVRDGITHIVATPHCDGEYEYDREHFTDMLATLSEVADGKLTFSIGCDFHLSPRNLEDALTIRGASPSATPNTCWSNSITTAFPRTPMSC